MSIIDLTIYGCVSLVAVQGLALTLVFAARMVVWSVHNAIRARRADETFVKALAAQLVLDERTPVRKQKKK